MAEARKRRELLPLIYHHLLHAGYVRAAREVKEQSGQKNFLPQPVTLLDLYTHWQQTSEVGQKRKAEDDAALQAKKNRVSDPVSSSESSEEEEEEEEEEAETPRAPPKLSLTNSSAVRTALSTSLKEKTPAKTTKASTIVNSKTLPAPGKTVAQLLSGKSPRKSSGPSADTVLVSETEEEGSVGAADTTVQPGVTPAGQTSSSSDETSSSSDETEVEVKPSVKAPQVKACPVPAKECPGKKVTPTPGKTAPTPPVQSATVSRTTKQEEDSDSTEEIKIEAGPLVATPSQSQQPSEKTGQVRGTLGLAKGTPGKGVTPAVPGKAGSATPQIQARRPEEDSETSSDEESDSEEEPSTTTTPAQAKPSALVKASSRKGASPAPTGRAELATGQAQMQQQQEEEEEEEEEEDSSSEGPSSRPPLPVVRAAPAQAKSLGKSPQSRVTPAQGPSMGPEGKGAASSASPAQARRHQEVSESSSSSDESDNDEQAPNPRTLAQAKAALKTPQTKVSPRKGTPVTPTPAKGPAVRTGTLASPALARGPQKPEEDSSSSEESESEEEAPASAVGQAQALKKSLPTKASLTPTKGPSGQGISSTLPQKAGPLAAQTRTEVPEDSTSSEEDSDSDEAARTPAQVLAKTLQTKPTPTQSSPRVALPKGAAASGKVVPAAGPAKQGSPAKAKPPTRTPTPSKGPAAATQAQLAPVGAEEDSDSSEEDSDSSEGAAPAQAKSPGLNSQIKAASTPAKGSPRKAAGPASTGQPGPTAPPAGKREENSESSSSSSSSTESESEEDAPAKGSTMQKENNAKIPGRKALTPAPQKKNSAESLESSEVIKLPLVFVDPDRSPAGPAAASAQTHTAGGPRKARTSESTAKSSSSESEDEDVIPATQYSIPAISLSVLSGLPVSSIPRAAVPGASNKTSSQVMDGKKRQATGTQVTKKQGNLPLTQAALKVLSQKASEVPSPAKTPSKAGVDGAPRTHHGTTTQAATTPRKPKVPASSRATTTPLGHSKASVSGTSGVASGRETVVDETSAESSEDEELEPSQSLLSGYVTPGPTPATPQSAKANPKADPSASGSSTLATKEVPRQAVGITSPAAGRNEAGTSPQKSWKPKKGAVNPQASVLALQSDIAQRLLGEPWPLNEAQVQASVVKVLAELLEQERRKALEATKDDGGKGRSGHKRKLQGDQVTAKAPEKKKKKKQHLAAQEGGENANPLEKAPRTAKGQPKREKPSGNRKKKKKGDPSALEAMEKTEGAQGQADVQGSSPKSKKEKKPKKKDKEKKKKTKKASTKDSELLLQKKKKKKKKKAEQPV